MKSSNHMALQSPSNFPDENTLINLSQLFDVLSDPRRYGDRWIARTGGSALPFTGTLRFITQSIDPQIREAKKFSDGLMANIPGISFTVPTRLDVFGQPIKRAQKAYQRLIDPSPYGSSPIKTDPVRIMMKDVDFNLSFPSQLMGGRKLNDDEYRQFLIYSGKYLFFLYIL